MQMRHTLKLKFYPIRIVIDSSIGKEKLNEGLDPIIKHAGNQKKMFFKETALISDVFFFVGRQWNVVNLYFGVIFLPSIFKEKAHS